MAAELFRALGDPHRLKALSFLATATPECCQGPEGVCACDLVTHLGLSQPTVSHHMKLLTAAGLVTATKKGRWVHYALSAEGFQKVQALLSQAQNQIGSVTVCAPLPTIVHSASPA